MNDKPVSEQAYPFAQIEAKWRDKWEQDGTYKFNWNSPKPKYYVLTMFSYPSGDKLHLGHWYNYGPTDSFARFKRMQGHEVFEPMGFDAFGLPAENYAIKTGINPRISTAKNVEFMKSQLRQIGAMYDWEYEVNTSTPEYYKWTQWWFLLLYKRGLAYQKEALVNWCPSCQTVLANEQVSSDNLCERCDSPVERKKLNQWFFKITDYNQRLLDGLDRIDFPEKTKAMQRYWIGKSEGTEIVFDVETSTADGKETEPPPNPPATRGGELRIEVFTTRADTLFGVTWVVLAPEHPLVAEITTADQQDAVDKYVREALALSEVDRAMEDRPKTGVFTGAYCVHPLTGERVPIWIADYVIGSYGTGAVMAVPAHDDRDYAFAKQYRLPIKWVIKPLDGSEDDLDRDFAYTEKGIMFASGEFDGTTSVEGIRAVGRKLAEIGHGKPTVTWHLRDWTISRQRYWGCPIPIIHCESCGPQPVPESELPVLLPEEVDEYKPKGKSPLESVQSYMNTKCPKCGQRALRDPDTMDTFVCSSWYYMRYPDAMLDSAPFDTAHLNKMLPIDHYVGGAEHAMGHLIYSRFFAKVAHDAGYLTVDEPYRKLVHQGTILHEGERMSKSRGNVVSPEPVLIRVGSDVLRCYLMFMGDYTQGGDWSDAGISGVERFIARVWRLGRIVADAPQIDAPAVSRETDTKLHKTIKHVTQDLEEFRFNTAIARLMELTNYIYSIVGSDLKDVKRSPEATTAVETLVKLIAPFAPHLGEELWRWLGHDETVFDAPWPEFDEAKAIEDTVTIAVQVNGKLRDTFQAARDAEKDTVIAEALKSEKVQAQIEGKQIVKTIVVPNKIVNVVVK